MIPPQVSVPVVTPLNATGSIDIGACRAYAQRANETWLDLFIVCGTIGLGESLTISQRRQVYEVWAEEVAPQRLLACTWNQDDMAAASDSGLTPISVLQGEPTPESLLRTLADLPAGAFVYSHPKYTTTTYTPAVASAAAESGFAPRGGKICKVSLADVSALRQAAGQEFQLYDGRCRHIQQSVAAGATGVIAVPLSHLPRDLPDRGNIDQVQQVINTTQELIDRTPKLLDRIELLSQLLAISLQTRS